MDSPWRFSLWLATASWFAAAIVARVLDAPIAGIAFLPPVGVALAGWFLGGFRLWPGALLAFAGLGLMAVWPALPADLALVGAGLFALAIGAAERRSAPDPAEADRRADERVRRELLRQKFRNETDLIRLAGGVAHQFNNLFTGILGHANRLRESIAAGHPSQADVRGIESAVSTASETCQQIVAYAGKGNVVRQPIELNEFLREVAGGVRPTLPNEPLVLFAPPKEPVKLSADALQLRRLFTNLLRNAAESHAGPGGTIAVRFGVEPKSEPSNDSRVWIEVADAGPGIDPAIRERLGDPFFTTKAPGRGLGLAAVRGIARAHGGEVAFTNVPTGGTVVRVVLLDRPTQELVATPPPTRRPTVKDDSKTGRDLALVVDDDVSVREMAAVTLRAAGWTVLTAENGEEALAISTRHGGELKLIVLDLLMPVMDGQMTLVNLRHRKSRVPIVVMSAYSDFDLSGEFAGGPPMAYLRKPFRPPELLECVAELFEKISVAG